LSKRLWRWLTVTVFVALGTMAVVVVVGFCRNLAVKWNMVASYYSVR
jgi:predicted membrane channel-forming protein YqfA (hemolysin III family)